VDQVGPNLVELVDEDRHPGDGAISPLNPYTTRQQVIEQLQGLLDPLVQVRMLRARVLIEMRVALEPADDALDAADGVLDREQTAV
jgi:hypothetical protein